MQTKQSGGGGKGCLGGCLAALCCCCVLDEVGFCHACRDDYTNSLCSRVKLAPIVSSVLRVAAKFVLAADDRGKF